MSIFIGNLNVFDHKYQEWQIFYGRLCNFIKLNKVDSEQKSALLLTHLSDETYRLARNLVHPDDLEKVTFEELVKVLNGHFEPKRSTFADRAKFYDAVKYDGESIEEWAARLRGLAVYCDFDKELETLLRDRFVLGLKAGPERDRLFEQDSKTLTFAKAVEIGQQAACARAARSYGAATDAGAAGHPVKEEPVYRIRERQAPAAGASAPPRAYNQAGVRCAVCGLKNHVSEKCRFKNYRCQSCGEKGHLKKMCSVKQVVNSQLHSIEIDSGTTQGHGCSECDLFNMRYVNYEPLKITVEINNKKFCMELDSGAGRSVMSEKFYLEHFADHKLIISDFVFCLYTKHKIVPLGYFICDVSYMTINQNIKFYVIRDGGPPLLGRDFMSKFNLYLTAPNNSITVERKIGGVQQLLDEFSDIWKDELGCFNKFEVELHLKPDAVPKFYKPRSIPFALKGKVEEELARLVKLGILIPVSFSEYATPIVPVLKENGKVKIAGDFSCTLNKDLKIDKYPLPHIEEVFAKIGGGDQYSKLDLSNAYNQFCLSKSSQELTTINTPKGLFKYTRLVYGLANAPAIFQKAMETLLAGIEGVSCWLDDVCCTAPTPEIHMARLREILGRLQDAGLRLQKEKCAFFQNSVTYLGYTIDKSGLRTCPGKVEAILKAPVPTSVLEVKRFLGVVNYYRNFIPNASALLSPLHELLRAGVQWNWGERQQSAFDSVKRELASERVLSHFEPTAPLVLTVDAGPAGLGAVLAHVDSSGRERPIAFGSRSLMASEKNYSQIQKEATAIIFGVKRFHQYLYGRQEPFILKTDHRPLLAIFGKKDGISVTAALRLQRYAIILSAYNYRIQYVSNKNNLVADYFSRAPLPQSFLLNDKATEDEEGRMPFFFLDDTAKPVSFEDLKRATAADNVLSTVANYMNRGWPRKIACKSVTPYFQCKIDLEVNNGCLFRGHRIVIPTVYREQMLRELHSAHFGIVKTKSSARSRMWWPGIDRDIEQWVGSCDVCASVASAPARAPPAPWPRPAEPWHRIHIDYMTVGQTVYLIIIDAFSKWLECIPMNCGTSTDALIVKLKSVFATFGIPNVIVSDNDVKICSKEFHMFCNNNGIKYLTSPIYHPASNGQAENSVKTCKKMIKSILNEKQYSQRIVHEKLLGFLFQYRNTVHCATGATPAMLMLGRNLRSRLDIILPKYNCKHENMHTPDQNLNVSRIFQIGEIVWVKWFSARKAKWVLGKITEKLGIRLFNIYIAEFDTMCKRHLDQIKKCNKSEIAEDSTSDRVGLEVTVASSPTRSVTRQQSPPAPAPAPPPASPREPATAPAPVSPPVPLPSSPSSEANANATEHGLENDHRIIESVGTGEEDGDEWAEANENNVNCEQVDVDSNCMESERPAQNVDTPTLHDREIPVTENILSRPRERPLRSKRNIDFRRFFRLLLLSYM